MAPTSFPTPSVRHLLIGQDVPSTPSSSSTTPGKEPPVPVSFSSAEIKRAFHEITPSLLIVGIATGAAFAIGSGLISMFIFKEQQKEQRK